jgi:hypothetical protein
VLLLAYLPAHFCTCALFFALRMDVLLLAAWFCSCNQRITAVPQLFVLAASYFRAGLRACILVMAVMVQCGLQSLAACLCRAMGS